MHTYIDEFSLHANHAASEDAMQWFEVQSSVHPDVWPGNPKNCQDFWCDGSRLPRPVGGSSVQCADLASIHFGTPKSSRTFNNAWAHEIRVWETGSGLVENQGLLKPFLATHMSRLPLFPFHSNSNSTVAAILTSHTVPSHFHAPFQCSLILWHTPHLPVSLKASLFLRPTRYLFCTTCGNGGRVLVGG